MAVTAEIAFNDVTFISIQTPIMTFARPSFSRMNELNRVYLTRLMTSNHMNSRG